MMAIKRKLLALAMCLCAVTAWADDSNYIINEDFNSSELKYPTSYHGWTLQSCLLKEVPYLKMEPYNSNKNKGYGTTPKLNYEEIFFYRLTI